MRVPKSTVPRLFGFGFFILWLLVFVDGLMQQTQMALFGGQVPIPTITLKSIFLILVIAVFMLYGRLAVPPRIMWWWWLFVTYLVFDSLVLSTRFGYSLTYIFFSYNTYYFYLLLFPTVYMLRGTLKEKIVVRVLLILFISLCALGLVQHFLGDPLLPVKSTDDYFVVNSWGFYGDVRAFALFSSGLNFGHYIALIAGVLVAVWYKQKGLHRFWSMIGIFLALLTTYTTLTRVTYFEVTLTLITALLISRFKLRGKLLEYTAVIYGLLGVFVTFGVAPALSSIFGNSSNIFSDSSLIMRYMEWDIYGGQWMKDVITALFGTGLIQNNRFELYQGVVIDNIILAFGIQIGIIGLILCLGLMWSIWGEVTRANKESLSPLSIGVSAFFSTWLFTGVLNITLGIYSMVAILLVLTAHEQEPVLGCSSVINSKVVAVTQKS